MHNNIANETDAKIKKLKIVLVLISSYLIVEIVAGYITGSLALLADASHMFTDTFGIGLALFATIYSKKAATPTHTYGFYRTEILASLSNSVILLLLSLLILSEAYRRIFDPPEIQSISMMVVAVVGLIINLIGILFLKNTHTHHHLENLREHGNHNNIKIEDLNIQGAKLELLSDTIGSIAIIIASVIIIFTDFWIIDPIIGIGLAFFIIPRTWSLLKRSVLILMEGVPSHISYEEVKKAIMHVKGVTGVFDLHIWSITSAIPALSAHVVVIDLSKSNNILKEINLILEKKFGITQTTIQIEGYHSMRDAS